MPRPTAPALALCLGLLAAAPAQARPAAWAEPDPDPLPLDLSASALLATVLPLGGASGGRLEGLHLGAQVSLGLRGDFGIAGLRARALAPFSPVGPDGGLSGLSVLGFFGRSLGEGGEGPEVVASVGGGVALTSRCGGGDFCQFQPEPLLTADLQARWRFDGIFVSAGVETFAELAPVLRNALFLGGGLMLGVGWSAPR
jgi:hypothetical protein